MNRDSILSVYSDARTEYTKQLCVFLVPAYFKFFIDLLEKVKLGDSKKALWQFQNHLNEIHDWNMEKVNNEIHIINVNCGCDYLEDLLTAVFIAHTKVLTAIRLSSNNKKVEINIPKVEHFLFKVLCETSKILWGSTYLFRDGISGIEKQQNYRNIEQLINEGILQAVRSLVPVKSILKDFVNNDVDDKDDKDDDEKEEKEEKVKPELTLDIPDVPLISEPVELAEPVKPVELAEPVKPVEPVESVKPVENQTIVINDKPKVHFGEFNTHFNSENPDDSEMVYDSNEEVPGLEILEGDGMSLNGIDFDSLDETPTSIATDEYEVLV